MAMHNPRFPRIRPLALSLLLACGAGASLPAMAGTLCVLYDTETGTQGTGGADTGTEDDRATACGKGTVAGLVATAIGTNAEASGGRAVALGYRSEEHTSELQSLMRISYAVFCLKKKTNKTQI